MKKISKEKELRKGALISVLVCVVCVVVVLGAEIITRQQKEFHRLKTENELLRSEKKELQKANETLLDSQIIQMELEETWADGSMILGAEDITAFYDHIFPSEKEAKKHPISVKSEEPEGLLRLSNILDGENVTYLTKPNGSRIELHYEGNAFLVPVSENGIYLLETIGDSIGYLALNWSEE